MISSVIVTLLLFFLPFLVFPLGISYFEIPKVYIAELCIIILSIIGILHFDRKKILQHTVPLILLSLLFLLSVYHLFFLSTPLTFLGNQFRHQGTLLLWLLLLFAYFSSQVKRIILPSWSIAILIALELLASIFIAMTADGRAIGTLGEPNALAAFAVFLWPFVLFQKSKQRYLKILIVITSLFVFLIVLLSGSRSGLIGFGIECIFFLLYHFFRLSVAKATSIGIILFLASYLLPFIQTQTMYENRVEIWKTALVAGCKHPILGWGFGNTEVALQQYDKKLHNNLQGYYVDSSHNIFLDFWIQTGAIGIALFTCILYMALRLLVAKKRILEIGLMFGLLVSLSFNPASIVGLLVFWWLIGQALFTTKT